MNITHSDHQYAQHEALFHSCRSYLYPVTPEKGYHDRTPLCIGCPYPRHGLTCWDKDSENCLRADMQKLEAKWFAEKP